MKNRAVIIRDEVLFDKDRRCALDGAGKLADLRGETLKNDSIRNELGFVARPQIIFKAAPLRVTSFLERVAIQESHIANGRDALGYSDARQRLAITESIFANGRDALGYSDACQRFATSESIGADGDDMKIVYSGRNYNILLSSKE